MFSSVFKFLYGLSLLIPFENGQNDIVITVSLSFPFLTELYAEILFNSLKRVQR